MKAIVMSVALLCVSCVVDMETDVISAVRRLGIETSDTLCIYDCQDWPWPANQFLAPCSWYEVGDSVNKWWRRVDDMKEE